MPLALQFGGHCTISRSMLSIGFPTAVLLEGSRCIIVCVVSGGVLLLPSGRLTPTHMSSSRPSTEDLLGSTNFTGGGGGGGGSACITEWH